MLIQQEKMPQTYVNKYTISTAPIMMMPFYVHWEYGTLPFIICLPARVILKKAVYLMTFRINEEGHKEWNKVLKDNVNGPPDITDANTLERELANHFQHLIRQAAAR